MDYQQPVGVYQDAELCVPSPMFIYEDDEFEQIGKKAKPVIIIEASIVNGEERLTTLIASTDLEVEAQGIVDEEDAEEYFIPELYYNEVVSRKRKYLEA